MASKIKVHVSVWLLVPLPITYMSVGCSLRFEENKMKGTNGTVDFFPETKVRLFLLSAARMVHVPSKLPQRLGVVQSVYIAEKAGYMRELCSTRTLYHCSQVITGARPRILGEASIITSSFPGKSEFAIHRVIHQPPLAAQCAQLISMLSLPSPSQAFEREDWMRPDDTQETIM